MEVLATGLVVGFEQVVASVGQLHEVAELGEVIFY